MLKQSKTKALVQAKRTNKAKKPIIAETLTLSVAGFEKISAVKGITLRPSTKKMFDDFDRRGLSPAERRREVLEKHAKKA
jgi:hypothetical protein